MRFDLSWMVNRDKVMNSLFIETLGCVEVVNMSVALHKSLNMKQKCCITMVYHI